GDTHDGRDSIVCLRDLRNCSGSSHWLDLARMEGLGDAAGVTNGLRLGKSPAVRNRNLRTRTNSKQFSGEVLCGTRPVNAETFELLWLYWDACRCPRRHRRRRLRAICTSKRTFPLGATRYPIPRSG